MQWDFWTLSPESAHQVAWSMGDRGIPRTWRHMNGYSSHIYMWVNAAGEKFWVKYHFKTDQGIECFTQDEADQMASMDTDTTSGICTSTLRQESSRAGPCTCRSCRSRTPRTTGSTPFDLTKVWPHGDYPLIEVGRMTLDRNPTDYHTEIEQAAFESNNLVPGIGPSPDKMLLAALLLRGCPSCPDGVNYKQIPVNAPKSPVHS